MLPLKKLYIDTRRRTSDSASTSNFKIELPETVTLPANCIFYVDDISIPHAWKTIEPNINDRLYVQLTTNTTNVNIKPNVCRIVQIAPGSYNIASLATELKNKLDSAFASQTHPAPVFNVNHNVTDNTLTFVPLYNDLEIKVLTPEDLADGMEDFTPGWDGSWNGPVYNAQNTMDINNMLGNNSGSSQFFTNSSPYTSGFVDLQPIKNLYLASPNLGTFSTIGPNGERTIIKKIPVTSNQNQMIFDNVTSANDYLDCSRQTIKTISFYLHDGDGNLVPLHNANFTFSLVFDKLKAAVE